jgi:hypothetical protein
MEGNSLLDQKIASKTTSELGDRAALAGGCFVLVVVLVLDSELQCVVGNFPVRSSIRDVTDLTGRVSSDPRSSPPPSEITDHAP